MSRSAYIYPAQVAFSSNGKGTVTIAQQETRVTLTLPIERGGRSMALDPQTHRIYLATAKF